MDAPNWIDHALAVAWLAAAGVAAAGRWSRESSPRLYAVAAGPLVALWLMRFALATGPLAGWLVLPAALTLGAACWAFADPDLLRHIPGLDWSVLLGNTARMPRCRTPDTHRRLCHEAKAGGFDLLFVGDSITARFRTDGAAAWDRRFAHRRAANFGVGGDRVQHLLWRITHGELDGPPPRQIVLLIGTNNLGVNTPAEIAAGVDSVVTAIRTRCPAARVLLVGLLPRVWFEQAVFAVNARLARLADGGAVRFLDAGPRFVDDRAVDRALLPDGLHLSAAGYERFADILAGAVDAAAGRRAA